MLRDALTPLRRREFRLLFVGRTISIGGNAMAHVALAFAVLGLGGSSSDLGLVLALSVLPHIVFVLAGGVIADRLPRNAVMVGSDAVSGAVQLAVAGLLLTGSAEIWHLAIAAVLRSTASSFFYPASQGIVPQTVPRAELQSANALLRLSLNATNIGGAALGGLVVAALGPGWAIGIDGLTYLVGAAVIAAMRLGPVERVPGSSVFRELAEGWHEFRSRRWLWVVVVGFAFANAAQSAGLNVLGPIVAERSLGGASAWGLVLAAQGTGLVVGGVVALRFRPRRPLLVGVAMVTLLAPPLALLALGAPLVTIALAAVLTGVGIELFTVYWDTTLQSHVPLERLSRVSAWDAIGSFALMPAAFAVVGPVADAIGIEATLWGCAGIVAVALAGQLLVRDVRELERVDAPPLDAAAEPG